jgi:hypothetical protein
VIFFSTGNEGGLWYTITYSFYTVKNPLLLKGNLGRILTILAKLGRNLAEIVKIRGILVSIKSTIVY